jgi:YVTN family beta-propeller protein
MGPLGRRLLAVAVGGVLLAGSAVPAAATTRLPWPGSTPQRDLPADWDVLTPGLAPQAAATPGPAGTGTSATGSGGGTPQPAVSARPVTLNVYASTTSGKPNPTVADITPRVYVPNSTANSVVVIDPVRLEVIDRFAVGNIPHHVAPAYDLSALYVDNEGSSSLTVIDPRSAKPVGTIPVTYPYNLYFTPDGSKAVVVVERLRRIEFWDPHSWQKIKELPIPWAGCDHLDFTADGRSLFISTEYTGMVARVDTVTMELVGSVSVGSLPIDIRLAPDGSLLYVANQGRHGVSLIDPEQMREVGFIPTGQGAHGLQVSRDAKSLYVSNRLAGTISVIDFATRQVVGTWRIGGSPDMLQLSLDGHQLWASSRFDGAVLVIDTTTGKLIKKIPTGAGAHGLTYFPNAGSISLGHNGVYR